MSAYSTVALSRKSAIAVFKDVVKTHPGMDHLVDFALENMSEEALGDTLDKHVSGKPGWALTNFIVTDFPEEWA